MHAVAEADPLQQVGDILSIVLDVAAEYAQGKRHVLPGAHVVEQAKILEYDADAAAQLGAAAGAEPRHILAENLDLAAGRLQRQQHQAQNRGLSGAGRTGQEVERARGDVDVDVAQNLGSATVLQPDISHLDHGVAALFGESRKWLIYAQLRAREQSPNIMAGS